MAREPSLRSATATSAPKWRSMRSVWSRVACASMTVVAPAACRPASSTADLIWAEGTGVAYSIGSRSAVPRRVSGSRSLPFSSTSSPICISGLSTRPMGRRDSEASPTNLTRISWPAIRPIIRRMPVPELPKSMSPPGSTRPPTPRPSTSHVAPTLRTGQPIACSALAVLSTSSPSSRPAMAVRPVASAPNISARCEIDLSPGTRTRPESARDLAAASGEEGVCDTGGPLASIGARPPALRGRCCAAIEQRVSSLSTALGGPIPRRSLGAWGAGAAGLAPPPPICF